MPNRDGTGPLGQGPRNGSGLGFGFGRGRGVRGGRGATNRCFQRWVNRFVDKERLEKHISDLENELNQVKQTLQTLNKTNDPDNN